MVSSGRYGVGSQRPEARDGAFECRFALGRDGIVSPPWWQRIRVKGFVPRRGNKTVFADRHHGALRPLKTIWVQRLVREHQPERRGTARLDEGHRPCGENIRHVTGRAPGDRSHRTRGPPPRPGPSCRPTCRNPDAAWVVSPLPLADEPGVAAGRVKRPRKRAKGTAAPLRSVLSKFSR